MMDPGETCPTCGQTVPDLANQFSTGTRSGNPDLHVAAAEPDAFVDPDGPLGFAIQTHLREDRDVDVICRALDVTAEQVAQVAADSQPKPYTRPGGSVPGHIALGVTK